MINRLVEVDKMEEECGVFGIYSRENNVALNTYWGLYALQHRGQESAGIAVTNGSWMDVSRGMGLVSEVFRHQLPDLPDQHIGIGHVRYSTTGSSSLMNTQPLKVKYSGGHISLAHNGNLTNARVLREKMEEQGSIFQTTIDSEVIVNLIARSRKATLEEKIVESLSQIEGAYCLVIMTEEKLIGVRDPHGLRPLCIGKVKDGFVLSSESCALDTVDAEFVRDVEPGEMVIIDHTGITAERFGDKANQALCVFEYIYFARPDSIIDGQSVYQARFEMGRTLARQSGLKADLVISVPDSGTTAALGFSHESGVQFAEGLIKNRYIGRTFIQPDQKDRDRSVKIKLNAIKSVVKGKSVIMVDDSIVRGTTSGKIVRMIREAGATAVHMCVSSPPIIYPCYYGIDTSVRKELIAATKSVEEIRDFIGADSLHYLTIEGLATSLKTVQDKKMCYACFNSEYPGSTPCEQHCGGNKYVFEQEGPL
ncbi:MULTISPECIES: amidophosphoribosyltransferase [Pelosinus]|uniref:Amidophosphoribosyltransferase n=1 Tax=Pelosinus fermentans B4 TaxID=1149862 RepID=I9LH96_9FIRM|nr:MULTISPECIES: amidophosphoribosyltransferase [Pelosinus]EIW19864.1 amidophosphoribosyltransferase [Pelosinus fermentans B4]EIW21279.1 amidophosphoribosyltransferase [Pelosinus fermentans A11]OAM95019.1 amidophosphoribosyltransferase [Pelosinus fermentans DSM 17108]SDR22068.1 amidophosphoribosyltransferase [Pelosinus fermentans]